VAVHISRCKRHFEVFNSQVSGNSPITSHVAIPKTIPEQYAEEINANHSDAPGSVSTGLHEAVVFAMRLMGVILQLACGQTRKLSDLRWTPVEFDRVGSSTAMAFRTRGSRSRVSEMND